MKDSRNHALRGALYGLACAAGLASLALAAPKPPAIDSVDNPSPPVKSQTTRGAQRSAVSGGNEGGIAGVVIWDNGPQDTGEAQVCAVPGTRSTLENVAPICLNVLGFSLTGALRLTDDFSLTECAEINTVTFYAYLTAAGGSAAPTVTAASVTLHSSAPWSTTSNVVATSIAFASPPALTTIYRATPASTVPCDRRLQEIVMDTSAWPILPPGTYWISWTATGASFAPPVTVLGAQGSSQLLPGMQGSTTTPFSRLVVAGTAGCLPSPAAVAQDMPFILEGAFTSGPCPGNTDGNCAVDVDDLVAVVLQWGSVCPCTADVDGDGDVDADDLVLVVLNWGACVDPPGPIATGACCVAGACSVGTFEACLASSGTYFGDGIGCGATGGCLPPANDDCAGASPVALGVTGLNTTLATNSIADGPVGACVTGAFQLSRDVWLAFPTVLGTPYTVDTLLTPVGLSSVNDTGLVVYSGVCGALVQVACNDDIAPGTLSEVLFVGDGGVMLIRVGTFVAAAATVARGGAIVLDITSP